MMRLDKLDILNGVTDPSQAEARLDVFVGHWNVQGAWMGFKEWVRTQKGSEDAVSLRKLKPRPVADVASCATAVVGRAVKNLQELLKEVEIMSPDGVLLSAESERLVCTDEKGFSMRSDQVSRGLVTQAQAARACAAQPTVPWEHITMTSFLPCGSARYGVGLVAPTSRAHESFDRLSPDILVRCNKSGSTNATIFAEFCEKCFAQRARATIPESKPIVLVLDSGGGSWLPLSPSFVKVCVRYSIRPFLYRHGPRRH